MTTNGNVLSRLLLLLQLLCCFVFISFTSLASGLHGPRSVFDSTNSSRRSTTTLNDPKSECPGSHLIFPCSCSNTSLTRLHCHDINLPRQLERIIQELQGLKISVMTVTNSRMEDMPVELLYSLEINTIIFNRVNFSRLSFSGVSPSSANHLRNSLHTIEVNVAESMDKWDWSSFKDFQALDSIRISGSPLPRLTKSFGDLPVSVKVINLETVTLTSMASGALAGLPNLQTFKVNYTPLTTFVRSALPRPAENLRVLDLSSNKLSALPVDMFAEMPNLQTLSLKDNQLQTVGEKIFQNTKLKRIVLSGNPFNCDCELRWFKSFYWRNKNAFADHLEMFCTHPEHLRDERLLALDQDDFRCDIESDGLTAPAVANSADGSARGSSKTQTTEATACLSL